MSSVFHGQEYQHWRHKAKQRRRTRRGTPSLSLFLRALRGWLSRFKLWMKGGVETCDENAQTAAHTRHENSFFLTLISLNLQIVLSLPHQVCVMSAIYSFIYFEDRGAVFYLTCIGHQKSRQGQNCFFQHFNSGLSGFLWNKCWVTYLLEQTLSAVTGSQCKSIIVHL